MLMVDRVEELEACCRDETDSTIVDLKEQGYTVEEISRELRISKGAVSKRWKKLAKRFRIRETF
jgi:DNA-binding NarL/FixJ family response regulator